MSAFPFSVVLELETRLGGLQKMEETNIFLDGTTGSETNQVEIIKAVSRQGKDSVKSNGFQSEQWKSIIFEYSRSLENWKFFSITMSTV